MLAAREISHKAIYGDYPNYNEPSVDLAVLRSFDDLQLEDDSDFVVELIDLFLSDAPKRLAAMRDSTARGQTIKSAAHCLRGSSGNLGALKLASICESIEKTEWVGLGLEFFLVRLEFEFARVVRIFQAERRARILTAEPV